MEKLTDAIEKLPLVDHHVHGALAGAVDRATFEVMITESSVPAPAGTTHFDSQVGFSIRRWCAPLLDLAPHCSPEEYLARRDELGNDEVNRRLLAATGVDRYLIETGYQGDATLGLQQMATAGRRPVHEVVRLEAVAEEVARSGADAAGFAATVRERLADSATTAVGFKSIVAYRHGFDVDPSRPADVEVARAADRWLREVGTTGTARVADPVLLRFLLWQAVDLGRPLQLHVGYGDADLDLHRSNPLLLTEWLRQVQGRLDVLLLHCYPFHREAGYLAQVFPHVYFDVGLALNYVGARSTAVVAESLELAPFAKQLYSSDAWGPAELHYLGALNWRRAMTRILGQWVDDGEWSLDDAVRVATMIGSTNARRVYGLPES
ncbi:amidohydrolase family protein [Planosporangium mesophilum]|uniref:Amidohydrolase n=1 Tax=Planosporangium mesophilum TaxID=689768 RepID=A0A8J3TE09_9ACTN|nr:amidohydrolase family protein [Planosporangium mesophilum]GII23442.1 amidohydrolase [Planosporangium mesophilum]